MLDNYLCSILQSVYEYYCYQVFSQPMHYLCFQIGDNGSVAHIFTDFSYDRRKKKKAGAEKQPYLFIGSAACFLSNYQVPLQF